MKAAMTAAGVIAIVAAAPATASATQYMSEADFLGQFLPAPPAPSLLALTPPLAQAAEAVLGHAPPQQREHYWRVGDTTVWVLSEIGKEQPITAGFVVTNGRIAHVRILTYLESRGAEVRYPSFLRQYEGAGLKGGRTLDHQVHGVAGATLSLWAMNKMARLALLYDAAARGAG